MTEAQLKDLMANAKMEANALHDEECSKSSIVVSGCGIPGANCTYMTKYIEIALACPFTQRGEKGKEGLQCLLFAARKVKGQSTGLCGPL